MIKDTLTLTEDEMKYRMKERVVDGLRYSIAKATLIAAVRDLNDGGFWRYIFRTPGGRFFLLAQKYNYPYSAHAAEYAHHTGDIEPISQEFAVDLWQRMTYAERLPFDAAFPDYGIQEA